MLIAWIFVCFFAIGAALVKGLLLNVIAKNRAIEQAKRVKAIAELDALEYQLESLAELSTGVEKIKALNELWALRTKRTIHNI